MRNPIWLVGFALVMIGLAGPVSAEPPSPVGRIKVVSGPAYIIRKGVQIPAELGQDVLEADCLRTGPDGRIGVMLKDDTRFSLGPDSEARLDRFVYRPADGAFGLALVFVRGVAAYVSGGIAKFAPDRIRLETPAAIVGVRGTSLALRVEP